MRWMACTLVAAVGAGIAAAVFTRIAFESAAVTEIAFAREAVPRAGSAGPVEHAIRETYEKSVPARAAARPDPVQGGAKTRGRAFGTELELDGQIDEELRWTEQALAASRRISEPVGAGRQEAASPASREALAAAAAGSSAVALGCAGVGLACLSSAECCPGFACAGGVAGYGTVGRCEVSR